MTQTYSKKRLYEIAEENYLALMKFCDILETEGYWEQPRQVLKKSIFECLDWYVQAVLIQLAVYCKNTREEHRRFIYSLSRFHLFQMSEAAEISNETIEEAKRAAAAPPVILQLCGLRDNKKQSGLAGLFFDAMLNIILTFAYLDNVVSESVIRYIAELYKRLSGFLYSSEQDAKIIDERYILYKISNHDLEKSSRGILEAGEDFESYRSITMPVIEKKTEDVRKVKFHSDAEEHSFRQYMKNKLKSGHASKVYKEEKREEIKAEPVIYEEDESYKQYIGSYEEYEQEREIKEQEEIYAQVAEAMPADSMPIEEVVKEIKKKTRLDELLESLQGLIGLTEVKKEINSLINLIKVKKLREKYCLPGMDMSYHMVFTGNPGTGKTTVARLVAEIYKEIGLLSKGNLVETDRAGLVAGFVGQTALKVTEVVERAVGGVLFIDEAYALSSGIGTNDFGGEAIDTLVKLMEDHRDDLVVIVAGYTREMDAFLKANTGLVSRFNKFIEFPDYSDEELIEILNCMSSKSGFTIGEEAISVIKKYLEGRAKEEIKHFGNARGIRNMFEKLVVNQANRIVESENPSIEELTFISLDDVAPWNVVRDGGALC